METTELFENSQLALSVINQLIENFPTNPKTKRDYLRLRSNLRLHDTPTFSTRRALPTELLDQARE